MGKLMTRFVSAFLCVAFVSLQVSFADVLQTGAFANKDVLTGANIKGHTAGLTKIDTDAALNNATLHFDRNTRIDWNKLNVYKDQTLTFKNGNFGVLNNVVGTSISKFAGTIKADSGKIVIANPNGILFEGGKFESLGGLVLTTKNLTNIAGDETTDFDNLNIKDAGWGDDVAIVAINNSSNISAADINIISKGIYVDSSTLASSNSNGIVLSTSDGSTFVASHALTADDGTTTNINFDSANNTIKVANSAVTTTNGALKLVSDKKCVSLNKLNLTGDLNATASDITLSNSTVTGDAVLKDVVANNKGVTISSSKIGGDIDIDSINIVKIQNTTGGDTKIVNDNNQSAAVYFINSTLDSLDVTAQGGFTSFVGKNIVNGDAKIDSYSTNFGSYYTSGKLIPGELTVDGDLTVTSAQTIWCAIPVTANNINFTTEKSSIIFAVADNQRGKLVSDNITLTSPVGGVFSLDANVSNGSSDYFQYKQALDVTAETLKGLDTGAIDLASATENGNLNVTMDTQVININTEAGKTTLNVVPETVTDVAVKSNGDIAASGIKVVKDSADTADKTGNASFTSTNGSVDISNITADTDIRANAENGAITASGLTADAEQNGVGDIILNGGKDVTVTNSTGANVDVTTAGDIKADGVTAKRGSDDSENETGNVSFTSTSGSVDISNITADTDIRANADGTITAGNLIADAEQNGVGDIILNGGKNVSVDTASGENVSITSGVDAIVKNVTGADDVTITTGGNATVTNTIADGDNDGIGDLTINGKGDVTVTGSEGANVDVKTTGNITAEDVTAKRGSDDSDNKTGNATFESTNGGTVNIKDITADTNIEGRTAGEIIASGLTADKDGNGVGDIILNGGKDVSVDTASGENVSITSGVDAIVKNVTGADDVTITTGGNATVTDTIADGDNDGIGDLTINGKGDVTVTGSEGANVDVKTTGNITAEDVTAKRGSDDSDNKTGNATFESTNGGTVNIKDITADTNIEGRTAGEIIASGLTADKDGNGVGDIILNGGKDVTVDTASGENVTITSGADAIVKNVTGADDVTITTGGNATVTDTIADGDNDGIGDLTINGKGDVTVTGSEGANVDVKTTGNITAEDVTAKRGSDDSDNKTGNANFESTNGGTVNIKDITADTNITGTTTGDIIASNLTADADKNGVGDVILNGGKDVTVDTASGENVTITAGNDGDVKNVTGADDVTITTGGDATVTDTIADGDKDGVGNLTINGKGDVTVDNASGENVTITAGKDGDVKNVTGADDVKITTGGDADVTKTIADGDKDGIGDLTINAGGKVNVDGSHGSKIVINADGTASIKNSTSDKGIYFNGIQIGSNALTEEVLKNLNNLQQSGVNTAMAQSFTPIAFAASDDDEEQSMLAKKIAKTVFKNPDGTVSITDRFDIFK